MSVQVFYHGATDTSTCLQVQVKQGENRKIISVFPVVINGAAKSFCHSALR